MKKNLLIVIALIVVLIIGAVIFSFINTNKISSPVSENKNITPAAAASQGKLTQENPEDIAKLFPSDFPFEKGISFTEADKYTIPNNSSQQFLLKYYSAKKMAENKKIFLDYFAENKFVILTNLEQKDMFLYEASKNMNGDSYTVQIQNQNGKIFIILNYFKK